MFYIPRFSIVLCTTLSALFFALTYTPHAAAAKPQIRAIETHQVTPFITELFKTDLIKDLATTKDHPFTALIAKVAERPLFVFEPTDHPASRLNFTAYMGLLALRHNQYANPLIADLYLLHELYHIGNMPYSPHQDFETWAEKMTLNEKQASFFSEAFLHFISDKIREPLGIPHIWADRLLTDALPLLGGVSNRDLYAQNPTEFWSSALQAFRSIGRRSYTTLDASERRTWIYDRSNSIWAQTYWPVAPAIEAEMSNFVATSATDQKLAMANHHAWLTEHMNDDGILFATEELEFHKFYMRLPHGIWQVSPEEIASDSATPAACTECQEASSRLSALAAQGAVERTPLLPVAERLLNLGVAGTVYSLPYPETMEVTRQLWNQTSPDEIFSEAYTRRQDSEHREFLESFKAWATPVVTGLGSYNHVYPSNGSSEAIKDTIAWLRGENPGLTIHIFEGEYEGVPAYAQGLNITIKRYPRTAAGIANMRTQVKPGDIFYLSQPSGIDGNLWDGYRDFMEGIQDLELKVLVDLAYVGAVAKPYQIKVDYPNVEAVFFSLSKSFGTYYQRIGGAFTKRPQPMLYGNMWFKNLLSLRIGSELLKQFDVYHLPRMYQWAQTAAIQRVALATGHEIKASDVILLSHIPADRNSPVAQGDNAMLYRGADVGGVVRYCLTPMMDVLVKRFTTFDPTKHLNDWRCKGHLTPLSKDAP